MIRLQFYMPESSGSLVTAIKLKAKYRLYAAAILSFTHVCTPTCPHHMGAQTCLHASAGTHKKYLNKSCIFFKDVTTDDFRTPQAHTSVMLLVLPIAGY
jgi:hypothetical protein